MSKPADVIVWCRNCYFERRDAHQPDSEQNVRDAVEHVRENPDHTVMIQKRREPPPRK